LKKNLGYESRVTVLGHLQRGGSPTYFDRYISTITGYYSVEEIIKEDYSKPLVIGLSGLEIVKLPLLETVKKK